MLISAELKSAHISPKKVQPFLGALRKKKVEEVLDGLRYSNNKAGKMLYKLVASAVANATNNYNLKTNNLKIKLVTANEGTRLKRYWLRSHGAADVKLKRMSHLRVVLEEIVPAKLEEIKKPTKKVVSTPKSVATSDANVEGLSETKAITPRMDKSDFGKPQGKGKSIGKRLFPRTTNK